MSDEDFELLKETKIRLILRNAPDTYTAMSRLFDDLVSQYDRAKEFQEKSIQNLVNENKTLLSRVEQYKAMAERK